MPVDRNFVTDLGLVVIDPGIGHVGQHFLRHVGVNQVAKSLNQPVIGLVRAKVHRQWEYGACWQGNVLDVAQFTVGFWPRSEEHTSELQSLMSISYAVFCLKKKNIKKEENTT